MATLVLPWEEHLEAMAHICQQVLELRGSPVWACWLPCHMVKHGVNLSPMSKSQQPRYLQEAEGSVACSKA